MENTAEICGLRKCMEDFLQERREGKLKNSNMDEDSKAKIIERFERETWLADAARRVSQLSIVTHALKYIHPDARGSNLYSDNGEIPEGYIGTSSFAEIPEDVVGHAGSLDIYKFLKTDYEGKSLLQRVREKDANLLAAFSDDAKLAESWMSAFQGLWQQDSEPSTHNFAKQLYFPLPDGSYHLLAPLFPSSLVQNVQNIIRADRYGEETKAARDARREGRFHSQGYCEYPDLLIQKFGGTKPQNISQLNSERHGENWLLPSLPPQWNRKGPRLPLGADTVFGSILSNSPEIKQAIASLIKFLEKSTDDYTNLKIRETRGALFENILEAIVQWAFDIRNAPAGWTLDERCRLEEDERFWLDPRRGEMDPEWSGKRSDMLWLDTLIPKAARWINNKLTTPKLRLGDDEYHAWRKEIDETLRDMEMGSDV